MSEDNTPDIEMSPEEFFESAGFVGPDQTPKFIAEGFIERLKAHGGTVPKDVEDKLTSMLAFAIGQAMSVSEFLTVRRFLPHLGHTDECKKRESHLYTCDCEWDNIEKEMIPWLKEHEKNFLDPADVTDFSEATGEHPNMLDSLTPEATKLYTGFTQAVMEDAIGKTKEELLHGKCEIDMSPERFGLTEEEFESALSELIEKGLMKKVDDE
jgi:hypothetical protein